MSIAFWSGELSRKIVSRIVVECDLVLKTPAHFGNGNRDDVLTDMPLLVDSLDEKTPLLTGASIAGALRNYLSEFEKNNSSYKGISNLLFGISKSDDNANDNGEQSPLIIEDSLGRNFSFEIRDGVTIEPQSRTAKDDHLFNTQFWQAGTTFPLRFELLIRETDDDAQKLKRALAIALHGLSQGNITLGSRKRRGFGNVAIKEFLIKEYDLTTPVGLCDWIKNGSEKLLDTHKEDLKTALADLVSFGNNQNIFTMKITCSLDSSLIIRAVTDSQQAADIQHLHSQRFNELTQKLENKPVISGTSLAGVLRARATKIINTLTQTNQVKTTRIIQEMFGYSEEKTKSDSKASRLIVSEAVLENVTTNLVQNRVSIDRFTSGARNTALFNEQPAFGADDSIVVLNIKLINPENYEIGLLLLLLKDLWTGDLVIGGQSSVGRGRLKGKEAYLKLVDKDVKEWLIKEVNSKLIFENGTPQELETYVAQHLLKHLELISEVA
ncbi:MAG: RAMP superfamily CRISPR-associated protein [Blastocatellia bacterium]